MTPHLAGVVRLHREQLAGGFLTSLGGRFLLHVFTNIATSRHGIALVATDRSKGTDEVVGFLLGTTSTGRLYRDFLFRYGARAVISAAPRLFSGTTMRKVWETLRYPFRENHLEAPEAELLDLAVSDSAKGQGLAQHLFHRFVDELGARGCTSFRITTGGSLIRAQRFYERLGARRIGTVQIHEGEPTIVYVFSGSDESRIHEVSDE